MQIIDVILEQNNLGTAIISNTIAVTLEAVEVAVAVEALSIKSMTAWEPYIIIEWTPSGDYFYAEIAHGRNKRPIPYLIYNENYCPVTVPSDCSDLNILRINSPEEINLIVLIGA
jgi:hypothetical protein